MLGLRLDNNLESRLDSLAKNTGRTKSWYVRNMIEDNIDDYELAYLALQAKEDIKAGKSSIITLEEAKRRLKEMDN